MFCELALAIGCSEHAVRDLVAVGLDLRYRLPQTDNDFGCGPQHPPPAPTGMRRRSGKTGSSEALPPRGAVT